MQIALPISARSVENSWPLALGLVAATATWVGAPEFFAMANRLDWDVASIYSGIFDVATVFTAFAFTFYSFVLTKTDGFIARMRGTYAYKQTKRFALTAMSLGVTLTIVSIPMFVIVPAPALRSDTAEILTVSAWTGLAFWAIAAFVRAARMFAAMAQPDV